MIARFALFFILLNNIYSYGQKGNKTIYNIKKANNTFETLFGYPNINLYDSIYYVNLYIEKDNAIWNLLKPFTNLEIIEISNFPNKILPIPSLVCEFKNLKGIHQYSKKTILPYCFSNISSLKEVSFPYSCYNEIPSEIYNLTNLSVLRIGKYTGATLTPEISNLIKLKVLEINNLSKIREIPPVIYNLDSLETLKIYSKRNIILKTQIKNLEKLKSLGLNLDTTDDNILYILSQLKNLKELILYHPISIKKSKISQLSFLETLTIYKGKLSNEELGELRKMLPNTKIIL